MPTDSSTMPQPSVGAHTLGRGSCALLLILSMAYATESQAQAFAAYATPPRFEIRIAAGQTSRQVLSLQNDNPTPARFRIYTADWNLEPNGTASFSEALAPDSCRPWVALERREITLPAKAGMRFRFEITPPAETPPRECRFALMVEGTETTLVRQGAVDVPVGARLGVIVYAALGNVVPQIEIARSYVGDYQDQKRVPMLEVRNTGQAHARLEGFLNGVSAAGTRYDIFPLNLPILPGQTRVIPLQATRGKDDPVVTFEYPLTVSGTLEIGAQRLPLEQRFAP